MYRMTTNRLGLSDLSKVLQEVHTVREKWFNIGIQLKLEPKELQRIATDHKNDYSAGLNLTLIQWLETGDASWETLCEAVQSPIVGECNLGKQLQKKHCRATNEQRSKLVHACILIQNSWFPQPTKEQKAHKEGHLCKQRVIRATVMFQRE